MTEIEISPLEPGAYAVRVTEGDITTDHRVTVPTSLLEELGIVEADQEAVVRQSFAFLLEREPATSILGEFSLDVIARYFPEYPHELPRRLQG